MYYNAAVNDSSTVYEFRKTVVQGYKSYKPLDGNKAIV